MDKRAASADGRIVAYVAQRARPGVLVPLALAVAAAAWTGVGWSAFLWPEFIATFAQSLLLVFAFRVWDDIESRRTNGVAPFIVFGVAVACLGMVPAVMIAKLAEQMAIIDIAIIVLIVWYHRRGAGASPLANAHAVSLVYLILGWAVAPVFPRLVALIALYLGACAFAIIADEALRKLPRARRVVTVELAIAAVLAGVQLLWGGRLW